jgi:2-dehydro-3-deoxyglucarate aldolase/4-hydroxy-2-oxoheptanedioate aldolase
MALQIKVGADGALRRSVPEWCGLIKCPVKAREDARLDRSFSERLRRGERLLGTIVTLPSPEVAELLALCGFDWLLVDLESGPGDVLGAQRILQAARCPCLIRLPDASDAAIRRVLDIGAAGVIVPGLRTAAEVEQVVAACRYPPAGTRGVGAGRANGYGLNLKSYLMDANDELVIVPQIGHIDAVHDIETIAAVPGVSALFVGPDDLAASMGYLGEEAHPEAGLAVERVRSVCDEGQCRLGIYAAAPDAAARWMGRGFTLVAVGTDIGMLRQRGRDILQLLK